MTNTNGEIPSTTPVQLEPSPATPQRVVIENNPPPEKNMFEQGELDTPVPQGPYRPIKDPGPPSTVHEPSQQSGYTSVKQES
jgi:hypothetical protein